MIAATKSKIIKKTIRLDKYQFLLFLLYFPNDLLKRNSNININFAFLDNYKFCATIKREIIAFY